MMRTARFGLVDPKAIFIGNALNVFRVFLMYLHSGHVFINPCAFNEIWDFRSSKN